MSTGQSLPSKSKEKKKKKKEEEEEEEATSRRKEKKETKELEGQCRRSSCATAHKYFR